MTPNQRIPQEIVQRFTLWPDDLVPTTLERLKRALAEAITIAIQSERDRAEKAEELRDINARAAEFAIGRIFMTKRKAQQIAKKITARLFVNGCKEKASRLQLKGPHEENLGGWSRGAVEAQIIEVLVRK